MHNYELYEDCGVDGATDQSMHHPMQHTGDLQVIVFAGGVEVGGAEVEVGSCRAVQLLLLLAVTAIH